MNFYVSKSVAFKVTSFLLLVLGISQSSFAQSNTFPATGNVGIGTLSPRASLDIGNYMSYGEISAILARLEEGHAVDVGSALVTKGYASQPNSLEQYPYIKSFAIEHIFYGLVNSSINFLRGGNKTGGAISFNTDTNSEKMRILANGDVGIGTTTPTEKLSVNGKIRSREVLVETSNWPDYVFKTDYELPRLKDVKTFIDSNHHLPEIPSAQEAEKNGINLGELNAKLLKKIEELTLYLIEKDAQLAKEKERNDEQQKDIEVIKGMLKIK